MLASRIEPGHVYLVYQDDLCFYLVYQDYLCFYLVYYHYNLCVCHEINSGNHSQYFTIKSIKSGDLLLICLGTRNQLNQRR